MTSSRSSMSAAFVLGFVALSRARLNAQARRYYQLPSPAPPPPSVSGLSINFPPQQLRHDTLHWNGKDRIIVIGDVHGCSDELESLLKSVEFIRNKDVLVFVGDLVRKGPNSKRVVKIARELNAYTVRGNHDHYAIEDKTNSLGLLEEDLTYLRNAPLSITIPELNTLIVHAGVLPSIPIENIDPFSLMTMRNVFDGKPIDNGKIGVPWVSLWKGPYHVVFGHDAMRGLQTSEYATGLDTGCVYGRSLSALILPERRIVSVPSSRPVPLEHIQKNHLEDAKL